MTQATQSASTIPLITDHSSRLGWRWIWGALNILIWCALAMHWTIRDQIHVMAVAYYGAPAVVIAIVAMFTAWMGFRIQTQKSSISKVLNAALMLVGVCCFAEWAVVEFRWNAKDVSDDAIKVVFWNIGRGHFASWERIARQVHDFDADVIALTEATSDEVQSHEFWGRHLPGYTAYRLREGMILLTKGSASKISEGSLAELGDYSHLSVNAGRYRFDLVFADVAASPLLPREKSIGALYELIKDQQSPTLVVGDLNTPPSSVWFDRWRANWTRAWDAAGNGYQPTWPQPIPVLALDHVWGNSGIRFQRCVGGWSSCSDHRPVIVNIAVEDAIPEK